MNREDIFHDIQEKLIQDLVSVVDSIKEKYKSKMHNPGVFDYSAQVIKSLQSTNLSVFTFSRDNLEISLNKVFNEKLNLAKHILEIRTKEVHNLINIVGDLYEMMCLRTEVELSSLESKIPEYDNSKQLVEKEVYKSKAFSSKEEHQRWLRDFLGNLKTIFDYVESKAKILAEKKGIDWKFKLMFAKSYLKNKFGISFDLTKLPEDIKVMRKAVLNSYSRYERRLIDSRYNEQEVSV